MAEIRIKFPMKTIPIKKRTYVLRYQHMHHRGFKKIGRRANQTLHLKEFNIQVLNAIVGLGKYRKRYDDLI